LPWILIGYLVMLPTSIAVPLMVAPRLTGDQVKQVEDLMLTISGLAQGLFGVLGVVVGYYFRQGQESSRPQHS